MLKNREKKGLDELGNHKSSDKSHLHRRPKIQNGGRPKKLNIMAEMHMPNKQMHGRNQV